MQKPNQISIKYQAFPASEIEFLLFLSGQPKSKIVKEIPKIRSTKLSVENDSRTFVEKRDLRKFNERDDWRVEELCVCVCERERERERAVDLELASDWDWVGSERRETPASSDDKTRLD
jgi:hypothetical protein